MNMKPADLKLANLQLNAPLARYTAARLGGTAEALVVVETACELVEVVTRLWETDLPFFILGGGSNVLVSDAGVRGVVVVNRARSGIGMCFDEADNPPTVWVEAGVNFGMLARQAALRGLSGLEWAAGIPGTVGGAVVGNAGAHGSEMANNLLVAEILHHKGREQWPVERLLYEYRGSVLKVKNNHQPQHVVLSALLRLARSTPEAVQAKIMQEG
jgi:UDP-N-acetylmuramate dehydrogenase